MATKQRYNVTIRENVTNRIVSTIGKDMTLRMAQKREVTGLMRIDTDHYFVSIDEIHTEGGDTHEQI